MLMALGPAIPYHCMWCGKTYAEHADAKDPRFTARMPCLGVKGGFVPNAKEVATTEALRARQRNVCDIPGCVICASER